MNNTATSPEGDDGSSACQLAEYGNPQRNGLATIKDLVVQAVERIQTLYEQDELSLKFTHCFPDRRPN